MEMSGEAQSRAAAVRARSPWRAFARYAIAERLTWSVMQVPES